MRLDGNVYQDCRFENCNLIYAGLGPVGLQRCAFLNVRWAFVDAASNTLAFMAGLYHGAGEGGRTVIEETFDGIRRGRPPTPEPVTATEEAESTAPDERTRNRA